MKVGIVHFFSRVTYFSVSHHFFFNYTGLEKTKEDNVPQNDYEKDTAKGPIAGNFIVN